MRSPIVLVVVATFLAPACARRSEPEASPAPRLVITSNLQPRLRLKKRLSDNAAIGCVVAKDGNMEVQANYRDSIFGGQFVLTNMDTLEWSKLWLFPGISDAATRLQIRSTLNLRTGRADGGVSLGLRRSSESGSWARAIRLVHRVPINAAPGCAIDIGASIRLPEEISLSSEAWASGGMGGLRKEVENARVHVDLDTLDLCIDR